MTINNAAGVTLSSPFSVQLLTLTAGKLATTSTNLLTISGTTTGSISGGSATAYVNGPLARTLPASTTTGTWAWPVGKSAYQLLEILTPTTNAAGSVVVQAEAFDANPGGTYNGLVSLTNNRYWQVSPVTGAGAFTAPGTVRLTETGLIAATKIGQSVATSANGTYTNVGGSVLGSTISNTTTLTNYGTGANSTFFVTGTPGAFTGGIFAIGPTANGSTLQPGGVTLYNGFYPTLTAATNAINNSSPAATNIILELQNDYVSTSETFPITSTYQGTASSTLTIRPRSDNAGTLTVSGSNATATIDLNTAKFVIIDGRPGAAGAVKALTIGNTNAAGAAIRFINDATDNIVRYTNLQSQNAGTSSGTVFFSTTTGANGNDNNLIDNNDIRDDGTVNMAANGIYSSGTTTTAAQNNDNIIISNNNIFNFFSAGSASNGILLSSSGNGGWTINNNRFYQTATRTYTTGNTHTAINIGTGAGYTITGNTIGFANSTGTGSMNLLGISTVGTFSGASFPSSYSLGTASLNATKFVGISAAFTAAGTASSIQNNTIAGIALLSSSTTATSAGILCGINVTAGNANIGTVTGNTIGATSGQGSFYAATSGTGGAVVGIFASSANTLNIQNNNIGSLDGVGTTASLSGAVTGIDIGSSASNVTVSNNTIGNTTADNIRVGYILNGANLSNAATGTGVLTSTSGSSSAIIGIRSASTGNTVAINSNTLQGWVASGTGTAVTGVIATGSMSGTTPSVNTNNNIIGTASLDWIRYAVANSGALTGISVANTIATTHSIQNNNIRGITHSVAGSSAHTYINIAGATATNNIATVNGNSFTNLNVNTTGTIVFINHNYSLASTGTMNLNNNSIVTGFTRTGAGAVTFTSTNAASSSGSILNETGNNFSNITVTGASTLIGINNTDGTTGTIKTITGNTLNNWSGTTNSITGMNISYINGASAISTNTITNFAGQGAITGIAINSSQNSGAPLNVASNIINNLVSSGTGGAVIGIACSNTSPTININANTINTLSSTGTSSAVTGISVTAGTATSTFANKIYDLSSTGVTPLVSGISITAGTAQNVYNNIIGDLRATAASNGTTDVVRGISVSSTTSSSAINVYYNTIRLAGSGGVNFSTSGVFHAASSTATTATLNLRNNIIINLCSPSGTGVVSALRRSAAATLGNYGAASNKNLLYAGTGSNRAIMYDGTTLFSNFGPAATAGTYQNAVATRDALSFTGEAAYDYSAVSGPTQFFQSITGSNANFLHVLAGITTQVEGGADVISTPAITVDYDGDTRSATKPDIGADEFAGVSPAPAFSNVTVPTSTCNATAHTINADIVPTTGTLTTVTLNYNNGAAGSVSMTNSSGNTWTGSIPAASPVNATVTWSITATNSAGVSTTFNGASYSDEPLFTVALTTTATPSTPVCAGASVALAASLPSSATLGTNNAATAISTVGTPYRTGTTSGTTHRTQYVVLASELTAAGVFPGNINSLGFTVTTASPTGFMNNLIISIGNTTATSVGTTYLTDAVSQVYSAATYTPVTGLNTHTFQTPFVWNGTSNILINICGTLNSGGTGSGTTLATAATTAQATIGDNTGCAVTTGSSPTGNVRPVLTFGLDGFAGYTLAWNDGVSNIATTSSVNVTPSTTTTYTFTITKTSNGCTKSSTKTVTVNPLPAAPTTTPSTQCGQGVPTASASGSTNGNYRWYTVPTGGTAIAGEVNSTLSTTSITTTTTYYVSINNGTCESSRTAVTASVNPPDALSASSNGPVCANSSLQLTATVTSNTNNNNYTYTWSASPASGSGIPTTVSGGAGTFGTPANTTVTPTAGGTYTYTVTANDNAQGCNTSATVTVTINAVPVISSVTANPATPVCTGSNVILTATSINGGAGTAAVGASTTTMQEGSPFRAGNGTAAKTQILYTASELSAAGILPGNITSLGFNFTTASGGGLPNFTVSMGNTAATVLTSTFQATPSTVVYGPVTLSPPTVTGIFTITLTTPFVWDGTSNILVHFCHDVPTGSAGSGFVDAGSTTGIMTVQSLVACTSTTGTTFTTRPRITFGATVGVNQTASLNWVWNPGASAGSTVTVTPGTTTVYTVTATRPATNCASSSTITVTVNPIPSAPTTTPSSQCGQGIPTASASGSTNGNYRWYTVPTGGTAIAGEVNSTLTTTSISTTTTFYVSIVSNGCESARTAVIVTVTQPDPLQASASSPVCLGGTVILTATVTSNTNNNNYTYTWSASPASGSGIPTTTSGGTGTFGTPANTTVTPTTAGTYTYTVTANDNVQGCNTSATVTVIVGTNPVITSVTANPNTPACAGSNVVLTAVSVPASAGTTTLGTGTSTTSTNGITPFTSNYEGARVQYLVRASELNAVGLFAGNITSLAFDVSTSGGGSFAQSGYTIKMATTALTALSGSAFGTPVGSFTTVFGPSSVSSPAVGIRTFTFTTPFNWDGTSNLLIDICHDNDINASCSSCFSTNSTVRYTTTAYNSVYGTYGDDVQSCGTTSTNTISTYTNRPNMVFGGQVGTSQTGSLTWSWNPGALSGNSVTVNPTTTTTYTVTAINPSTNCSSTSTITITPIVPPAAPNANSSIQCGTAVPAAFVTSNQGSTNGNNMRWYSAQTGGTLLQTGGFTYTTAVSSTTTFWVSETNGSCESLRVPVTVSVNPPDPLSAASNGPVCGNTQLQLTATVTSGTNGNVYSYVWTASPAAGSGIPTSQPGGTGTFGTPAQTNVTPTTAGTYTYTVTGTDGTLGCVAIATVVVTVKPVPFISSATASPATPVCAGATVTLQAQSITGAPGTITLGAGSNTTTLSTDGTPYRVGNTVGNQFRNQYLFLASELQAAGLGAGNISSVALTVSGAGGGTLSNFAIKLGTTAQTALTSTYVTGLTSVLSLATYPASGTLTTGVQTHTFTTPFAWDGVSNIVLEMCAQLATTGSAGTLAGDTQPFNATILNSATTTNCSSATGAGVSVVRPKVTFGGFVGTDLTSSYNWTWNPGSLSGSSVTVTPSTTTTYTVTALNASNSCSSTSTVTVSVNPLPPAPSGNNGTDQCGTALTDANVSSNNTTDPQVPPFFKWYFVPTGGTAQQSGTSATFLTPVGVTTDFYVSEVSANGCEGPRVHISTVVSEADPITVSATPTTICLGSSASVSASYTPNFNSYAVYELTATGGTASGVTGTVSINPNGTGDGSDPYAVTPTASGTYTYTITAFDPDKNCSAVNTVVVTVTAPPVIATATATPNSVCAGGSVLLAATTGTFAPGTAAVGTQTTTLGGVAGNPYRAGNGTGNQIRTQLLYTAAELTAAGLTSGNITSIGLTTTSSSSGTVTGFTIKMGTTVATALTTTFETTPMTTVFTQASFTPLASGLNTHTLSTPFFWNGTSNIIIDFCQTNSVSGTATVNAYTPSYASNTHKADGTTSCTDLTGTAVAAKPVITFGAQVGVNTTANNTWVWNPGNINAGTTGSTTVTPAGTTTYTVTATSTATGCANTATVTVTVNPIPAVPTTNSPVTRCGPGSVTLTATGSGGTINWYNVSTGGTSLFTGSSYTISVPVGTATYYAEETSAAGCIGPRSAVTVTASTPPALVITPGGPTTFCGSGSVVLNGASASSPTYTNFSWAPATGLNATNTAIVTANPTVTTTYTLTANDGSPTGCINITTITVTINAIPVISSATANPSTVCAGGATSLIATSISGGTGVAAVGTQSTTSITAGPYRSGAASDMKVQYLFTAAELSAAGVLPGNITSIAFNVTSVGDASLPAFTISMGNTTASTISSTFDASSLTTVLAPVSYTAVSGLNTHTLTTPFNWNGTSNIIVQVCHGTSSGLTSSTVSLATATSSTTYTTGTGACTLTSGTSTSTRAVITFGGQVGTNLTSSYNWVWNPGNLSGSTTTVTPTTTTTYTVVATNAATSCSSAPATVTVTVSPVGASVTATPSTPVCVGTSVTLNGVGTGGGPFTYAWASTPSGSYGTTASINVTPTVTTTYTLTVTDACGSPATASVTVTVNPLPTASIAETTPINICSPATQVLTAVTNAGTASYQWTLNGNNIVGATSSTYTVTATGSYRVIVTNTATNCVSAASAAVVVNVNTPPTAVSVSPATATVCAGVSTNLTASGGMSATNVTIGTGTTQNAVSSTTNLPPYGNYYTSNRHQILVLASELTAAGLTNGSQLNSIAFDVVSNTNALGYNNFTIRIGNTTATSLTTTFLTSTTTQVFTAANFSPTVGWSTHAFSSPYTWNGTSNLLIETYFSNCLSCSGTTCSGAASGTTYTQSAVTNQSTTAFASHAYYYSDATSACGTGPQTVTTASSAVSVRPNMRFGTTTQGTVTWLPATGLNTTTGLSVTATPTTTTTYTATATNAFGCTAAGTATITVNPRPTGTLSGGATYCAGQGSTATTLSIAVTGAGPWSGTLSPGAVPFSGSSSPITVSVTPSSTTTYTIATLNGSQCSSIAADLSGSATVTINPVPAIPTITPAGPITQCGGTVTLTSSSATGNQWNLEGSPIGGATNQTLVVSASGNYSVTVTNGFNCSVTSLVTAVMINPVPATPTVTPAGPITQCGGTVTLTSSSATGNQWNLGGSPIGGATNQTLVVSASGNYSVTVTNGFGCSATSANTTVTINPLPATPTITPAGPVTQCGGTVTLTASTPGAWQWNLEGSPIGGANNQTLVVSASGNYSVTVTNEFGCSATSAVTSVTINPVPATPTITPAGPITQCGGTVTLTSSSATGNQWNLGGSPIGGQTGQTLVVSASGIYSVTVTNGFGCSATSATISVTINPVPATPTVTPAGPVTQCGGTVTLTSSSATGNQWNLEGSPISGATNTTLVVSASGNYSVTVTNGFGCSATSAVTSVTINPVPATPTISAGGPITFCAGGSVTLTSSAATNNQWNLNGSPIGGATNSTLVVTASGDYTVTVTNAFGCTATSAITTVTVNPLAANPTASVVQPTCALGTGTINVTAPLGAGNTYSIGGPFQSSPSFPGVNPGTYTVYVQNSAGCFSPATVNVTVNPQPFVPGAPVITGTVNVCPFIGVNGAAGQLTYTATATGFGTQTFNWVVPPTNVTIVSGQGTGTLVLSFQNGFATQANKQLRLTVTNQCGTSTMTIYYLAAQIPTTPNPIVGPTDACPLLGGPAVSYTIPKAPGAASYSWVVPQVGTGTMVSHPNGTNNPNDTTILVSFLPGYTTGTITVQSINDCGVSGLRSITVTRIAPSQPNIISGPTNACPYITPNAPATYTVPAVPGVTYQWSANNGAVLSSAQGSNTMTVSYPIGYTGGTISVTATTGCGTSAARNLTITTLNPATPGVPDIIQTHFCGEPGGRKFTYTLSSMPANATSVLWTVPAGATFINLSPISIEVTYPDAAVSGVVTVQASNPCANSVIRSVNVKLSACPTAFAGNNNGTNGTAESKGTVKTAKSTPAPVQAEAMEVKIFPNPTVSDFKLEVLTSGTEEITVRVLDNMGRLYKNFKVMPYQTIALGAELKAGSYLVEVRQGKTVKTTKLIKF
ncbi:MAG: T9SS type A sorting domain-containing protein [Ferruginibacter sp.]